MSGRAYEVKLTNGWSLEITTCERIMEDNLGETRPVELPLLEYLRTKTIDDRGKRWSAWLDDLAGQYVGVDDGRAARRQLVGHHAFPRRDPARQAHPHHGRSLFGRAGRTMTGSQLRRLQELAAQACVKAGPSWRATKEANLVGCLSESR